MGASRLPEIGGNLHDGSGPRYSPAGVEFSTLDKSIPGVGKEVG
jgi:hypothetical protein